MDFRNSKAVSGKVKRCSCGLVHDPKNSNQTMTTKSDLGVDRTNVLFPFYESASRVLTCSALMKGQFEIICVE